MNFGKFFYSAARFVLGPVFIYSALAKINSPQDFADQIAAYQVVPAFLINPVALGLPLFELVCGILVLSGIHLRTGALGICLMLALFTGTLVLAVARGVSVECGCFGAHSWLDATPRTALIRDLILLAPAAMLYRFGTEKSFARTA